MRAVRRRPAPVRVLVALLGLLVGGPAAGDAPGVDFVDPRVLDLDPPDTRHGHPARVVLSGRLVGEHRAPVVVVIEPDGRAVEGPPVEGTLPEFRVELSFGRGRGVYRVEVIATTPDRRTHSGARLRFFVGVAPGAPDDPEPPDADPDPEAAGVVHEARLFRKVNALRRRASLDPFPWLEPLAVVARDHLAAAVKRSRLDHRVDAGGNVAERLARAFGWRNLEYALPPDRPAPGPGAKSWIAVANDAETSLDRVLYRWSRFAAFALPMTSERMTHAACAVRRAKDGTLWITFVYAQLNDPVILLDVEGRHEAARRAWKAAPAAERADRLRDLGLWRTKEAAAEVRRQVASADPDLRAAALDAGLVLDEADARTRLDRALADLDAARADPRRAEAATDLARWLGRVRYAPEAARAAAGAGAPAGDPSAGGPPSGGAAGGPPPPDR